MKAVVFNLGCKVNQYECDLLSEGLSARGYEVSEELGYADLYVINTCAVTAEAEKKSRQAVARCRKYNDNCSIIVCGCASEHNSEAFRKDNVTFISGVANKQSILDHIDQKYNSIDISEIPSVYEDGILRGGHRTRAYVKIQDGCNNFCSYCLIPYLRGRSRSREISSVVKEVDELSRVTDEIVLTGINFTQYGEDTGTDLATLIRALNGFEPRIRLGSFYVEALNRELLDALFSCKRFCPHFHLSLQSGDDSVLKKMNRKYSSADYLSRIELIRTYDKNASITTDVIVGFPTETEEEFHNTVEFIKKVKFSDIHVFPFSAREGTVAYDMPKIDAKTIDERRNVLLKLKKELIKDYLEKNIGVEQNVLFEECVNGISEGYSERYIRIYKEGDFLGRTLKVTPTAIYKHGLK